MKYDYILKKIKEAEINKQPFQHVEINNLFALDDFNEITKSKEIHIKPSKNDNELFENLFHSGYKIINFPGCIQNQKKYIKWHDTKKMSKKINTSCEGFGVTFRLVDVQSTPIRELMTFLESQEFKACITKKFEVKSEECSHDQGIQKYLDGYEISPHPDIKQKALTYMVNINPNIKSELEDHHTHYLKFKPKWEYIQHFWKYNNKTDTCWVPWSWCQTEKIQNQNNSMVIFSPSSNTLHGVKANYNHLKNQRTQLYGNLWYKAPSVIKKMQWEGFLFPTSSPSISLKNKLKKLVPSKTRPTIKKILNYLDKDNKTHTTRDY